MVDILIASLTPILFVFITLTCIVCTKIEKGDWFPLLGLIDVAVSLVFIGIIVITQSIPVIIAFAIFVFLVIIITSVLERKR